MAQIDSVDKCHQDRHEEFTVRQLQGKDLQERQSVSVYLFLQMRATGVYEFAGIKRIFQIQTLRDMKKDMELLGDPYCELT